MRSIPRRGNRLLSPPFLRALIRGNDDRKRQRPRLDPAQRPPGRLLPPQPRGARRLGQGAARRASPSRSRTCSTSRATARASAIRTGSRTHPPAKRTAEAVKRLLAAGADMVGRTHCDELCYSLTGENVHYGAPVNVNAPGRIPGGSSNGSAAAVAGKLVDFAIGSDCGGSVRIPASYCGILGMRPTWGRVSLEGAVPFGPSFDVAGWFARDAAIFEKVGRVLLEDRKKAAKPKRLLIARDAFALRRARGRERAPAGRRAPRGADRQGRGGRGRAGGPRRLVRDLPHHPGRRGVGKRRRLGQRGQAEARARRQGAHRLGRDRDARDARRGQRAPRRGHGAHGRS